MLTVHHLENSRSHRILWLLEELEADYEIEYYERHPKTMLAPTSLREIHPLGKAPVVTDGDRTIAESGAIIEYLLDKYDDGELRPEADTAEFLRYRYWMHYAEGSAMNPFFLHVIFDQLPKQGPWLAKPLLSTISKMVHAEYIDGEIERHTAYWESELSDHPFFAGDQFTAADVQMSFALESALTGHIDRERHPNIHRLAETLRDRPAYQRAIDRGGELSLEM